MTSNLNLSCGAKSNSNATENSEGLTNDGERHRGTGMPREMDRIIAAIEIGEYLKNVVDIICLWSVSGGVVFGLST